MDALEGGESSGINIQVPQPESQRTHHARSTCRNQGGRIHQIDHSAQPVCVWVEQPFGERKRSCDNCDSNCKTSLGTDSAANAAAVAFSSPAWYSVSRQAMYASATLFPNSTGSREVGACARAHSAAAISDKSDMAHHLFFLGALLAGLFDAKHIRANSLEIHQPCRWNPGSFPLRYRGLLYLAKTSHLSRPA